MFLPRMSKADSGCSNTCRISAAATELAGAHVRLCHLLNVQECDFVSLRENVLW